MSVEASRWAWQQDVTSGPKIVLLALADHADQNGFCWPGADGLAQKCGLTRSSIWRHINTLQQAGLIEATARRDGPRNRTNAYQLMMQERNTGVVTVAKSDGENTSPSQIETVTVAKSDGDSYLSPSQIETGTINIESSLEPPEEYESPVWPAWFSLLWGVEGFKTPFDAAEKWRTQARISIDLAEQKANALRDWWPTQSPQKRNRRDPYKTWQNWCRRDRDQQSSSNRNMRAGTVRSTIDLKEGWQRGTTR